MLEVRGGQSTVALGALSLLVLVVLVFAFNPGGGEQGAEAAAGALWVALVFSGMLGATRRGQRRERKRLFPGAADEPARSRRALCGEARRGIHLHGRAEAASIILMVLFFNSSSSAA